MISLCFIANNARRGTVYLLTLVVVIVVASVAVVMADGSHNRLRAQQLALGESQCRAAAHGVLRAMINDITSAQTSGVLPGLVTVTPEGETLSTAVVIALSRDPQGQALRFGLIAENSRIDINNSSFAMLMAVPSMTTDIAAAIIDWRDDDDIVDDNGGAESTDAAYAGASVPYAPRNGPFENIDELRLVRGVTDELFFGEDRNQNGRLDPGEDRNGDGQISLGFRDLLCIDNREPATPPNSSDQRLSIAGLIDDRGRPSRASFSLRGRLIGLFGDERGAVLYAQAIEQAQAQPFANRLDFMCALTMTDTEIVTLWPQVIGPEGRLGLIDAWSVNDAVLNNLVSREIANAIISARPPTAPANPAWLVHALNRVQALEAGNYLTSGSYQLRADLIAVTPQGNWMRFEARIACETGLPYVSMLRPTRTAGWPFPWIAPSDVPRQRAGDDILHLLTTERN